MSWPQGTFFYPGISGVLGCSVTIGLGINPSSTQVTIPPVTNLQPMGTAVWSYNGTVRTFPNSIVDEITVTHPGGRTIWNVAILDRRWAWQFGQISGEYNVRKTDGAIGETEVTQQVMEGTEKNPRELATLCLEAMGEGEYDVSILPINDLPYVKWEVANPAKMLADICEMYGCAVSLQIDDSVKVVRMGAGAEFPADDLQKDVTINPANVPKKITAITAPVRWQMDLELEAVGQERELLVDANAIKPIDELSYRPDDGFGEVDFLTFSDIENRETRARAVETVFRWYRITTPPLAPDGAEVSIESINQLLPLIDELGESLTSGSLDTPKKAKVWGRFFDGHGAGANNTDETPRLSDFKESLVYKQSFTVDTELGLVKFSEPMYFFDGPGRTLGGEPADPENPGPERVLPAVLFLRCCVNIRDPETRAPQRQFKEITINPASPTEPKYLVREDIIPRYRMVSDSWESNATDIEEQADYYLQQELVNYRTFPSGTAEYPGFVKINTDGAIRQISYQIDSEGKSTSKLSRNSDLLEAGVSYVASRRQQRIGEAIEKERRESLKPRRRGGDN